MSAANSSLPSLNQKPLSRSRALYLGTSVFSSQANKFDESKLTLDQLQKTIGERYPIDGSQYAKGVETWLSIFTNGLQMEHSASSDTSLISALFYYPIKSLVYCGALRFINDAANKFVPLDTDIAQAKKNSINPALFVVLLKGVDSATKNEIIETNVFVVGTKEISLGLVESCQQAYTKSKISRSDFYKKYGNIPVVFCLRDDLLKKKDKRVVVKHFDFNGYFYATENTDIDHWQLFETAADEPETTATPRGLATSQETTFNEVIKERPEYIDPYEKSENLIGVDKRVDPETGQNIYVRYLRESVDQKIDYESLISPSSSQFPAAVFREEKTPSPIVYERYIKKKAPQVIIKEIHVEEPAPPPIKYVQKSLDKYHNQMITGQRKDRPVGSTSEKNDLEEQISIKREATREKKSSSKDKESKSKRDQSTRKSTAADTSKPFSPPPPPVRSQPSIYTSMPPEPPSRKSSRKAEASSSRQQPPIYAGVEHIKSNHLTPQQQQNSSRNDSQIQYKEYNPYSEYANYNGVPTQVRRNQQIPQQGNYNSYTHQNPYSGHAVFMHSNYHNTYTSHQKSYRNQQPDHQTVRNVDERRPSINNNNNIPKYDRHHTYNSRTTYQTESKEYRGDSTMERKKKIYVVHENELDLLKAKLRATHRNKKIVVVDESEIDTLKERIFGDSKQQQSGRHYHSRRYE